MTDKEKEVFNGFLSKTLNLSSEDVASLYNEAGELTTVDLLLQRDSERVKKFKTDNESQFKAGEKKAFEKIEKYVKTTFNIGDTELLGTELIDHAFKTQTAELQEKLSKKFDPAEIEKHPAFIAKRAEWENKEKSLVKEWEGKLESEKNQWNQQITLGQVSQTALNYIQDNFIMPENAERAAYLKQVFVEEVKKRSYNTQEGSDPIILNGDKPLEDEFGHIVPFKTFIEGLGGKLFDKKIAQQRGNAGNQPTPPSGQPIVIKDQSDFKVKMAEATTPEDRAAVMKAAKVAGLV